MTDGRTGTGPRGSINNPLTEADLPFAVPVGGFYWMKLDGQRLTPLPFAPEGSTLAVEVVVHDE